MSETQDKTIEAEEDERPFIQIKVYQDRIVGESAAEYSLSKNFDIKKFHNQSGIMTVLGKDKEGVYWGLHLSAVPMTDALSVRKFTDENGLPRVRIGDLKKEKENE